MVYQGVFKGFMAVMGFSVQLKSERNISEGKTSLLNADQGEREER